MTFIDKNSSSHTAQSVTLYLQKEENQTVEVWRGPTCASVGAAKGYDDEGSSWAPTLDVWFVSTTPSLLYFLRRVAAPFLLL